MCNNLLIVRGKITQKSEANLWWILILDIIIRYFSWSLRYYVGYWIKIALFWIAGILVDVYNNMFYTIVAIRINITNCSLFCNKIWIILHILVYSRANNSNGCDIFIFVFVYIVIPLYNSSLHILLCSLY